MSRIYQGYLMQGAGQVAIKQLVLPADPDEARQDLEQFEAEYRVLRGPEAGLAMVRGRAGGGGAPFHLGEMTVTRCSVRTEAGFVGHAYIAGRSERAAQLAALADALRKGIAAVKAGRPVLIDVVMQPR